MNSHVWVEHIAYLETGRGTAGRGVETRVTVLSKRCKHKWCPLQLHQQNAHWKLYTLNTRKRHC